MSQPVSDAGLYHLRVANEEKALFSDYYYSAKDYIAKLEALVEFQGQCLYALDNAHIREHNETRRELVDALKVADRRRARPKSADKEQAIEEARITGGMCPCCAKVPLFEEGRFVGEIDHFSNVGDARIVSIWAICKQCNRRHILPAVKSSYFRAHKDRVAEDAPHQSSLL